MKFARCSLRGRILAALVLVAMMVLPGSAFALQGGPDRYGYRYIDSNSPGGPAFEFEEIASAKGGTGTNYAKEFSFNPDVGIGRPIPIGFKFKFYGQEYEYLYPAANGYLLFSLDKNMPYDGSALPSTSRPNNLIAPFWGKLDAYS